MNRTNQVMNVVVSYGDCVMHYDDPGSARKATEKK